ncbi:MAG TPA: hypothetical protein DIW77_17180, partial [Chromatiaceae bacterium]|nr:hypothetical protein [Chromatiaceae bacterium]
MKHGHAHWHAVFLVKTTKGIENHKTDRSPSASARCRLCQSKELRGGQRIGQAAMRALGHFNFTCCFPRPKFPPTGYATLGQLPTERNGNHSGTVMLRNTGLEYLQILRIGILEKVYVTNIRREPCRDFAINQEYQFKSRHSIRERG